MLFVYVTWEFDGLCYYFVAYTAFSKSGEVHLWSKFKIIEEWWNLSFMCLDLIDYIPVNDCFISLWIAKHLLGLFQYELYI